MFFLPIARKMHAIIYVYMFVCVGIFFFFFLEPCFRITEVMVKLSRHWEIFIYKYGIQFFGALHLVRL